MSTHSSRPVRVTAPEARSHGEDLTRFVTASPSSFHAAQEVRSRLESVGTQVQEKGAPWQGRPGLSVLVQDGAVIAWSIPAEASSLKAEHLARSLEFRIVGSHTDSPAFKLKPAPNVHAEGWAQAGVEVYGGPLGASWFDRELGFAGRLVTRDGRQHLVRTGPIARIPRLAIHLDRSSGFQEEFHKQRHTAPVLGQGDIDILDLLARAAGLASAAEIVGHDVVSFDTQIPQLFGAHEDLLASGRLDNLSSVHGSLAALERLTGDARSGAGAGSGTGDDTGGDAIVIPVLAAFDHEEVGSDTRSGAGGPLLADVLTRTLDALGLSAEQRAQVMTRSSCLSCDAGHGVHPNYPERHDPTHHPRLGSGPLTKINANQRYATDAVGAALWRRACEGAGVSPQPFVSNNDVPCGSTIGPITATRLGLRTIDVGVPLLSMHSVRELAHIGDLAALSAAMEAYWRGA